MSRLLCTLGVVLALAACRSAHGSAAAAGSVRFFRVANSAFDRFTRDPGPREQAWMRRHYWRMLTYNPYFDTRLDWYRDAWAYKDLYAIYAGSALADEHPEWILRDARGNRLFIPYDCARGTCPQYAADVGDPAFRAHWLAGARALLANGYRGLFVDDVNMTLARVANGDGQAVPPLDPRTGRAMAEADWRRAMASFTEEIRAAFPDAEIAHNPLWFVGHDDPSVQRQLLSADVISLERGVNDPGLRGGRGPWGFETFFAHVDWLQGQRRQVILEADAATDAAREYGLAAYLLVNTGRDALGNGPGGTPADWWGGYDVALGPPLGTRYAWSGVLRRDFARGLVLLNQPEAATRTLALETACATPCVDLAGQPRRTLTLGPAAGAVLRHDAVREARP